MPPNWQTRGFAGCNFERTETLAFDIGEKKPQTILVSYRGGC